MGCDSEANDSLTHRDGSAVGMIRIGFGLDNGSVGPGSSVSFSGRGRGRSVPSGAGRSGGRSGPSLAARSLTRLDQSRAGAVSTMSPFRDTLVKIGSAGRHSTSSAHAELARTMAAKVAVNRRNVKLPGGLYFFSAAAPGGLQTFRERACCQPPVADDTTEGIVS